MKINCFLLIEFTIIFYVSSQDYYYLQDANEIQNYWLQYYREITKDTRQANNVYQNNPYYQLFVPATTTQTPEVYSINPNNPFLQEFLHKRQSTQGYVQDVTEQPTFINTPTVRPVINPNNPFLQEFLNRKPSTETSLQNNNFNKQLIDKAQQDSTTKTNKITSPNYNYRELNNAAKVQTPINAFEQEHTTRKNKITSPNYYDRELNNAAKIQIPPDVLEKLIPATTEKNVADLIKQLLDLLNLQSNTSQTDLQKLINRLTDKPQITSPNEENNAIPSTTKTSTTTTTVSTITPKSTISKITTKSTTMTPDDEIETTTKKLFLSPTIEETIKLLKDKKKQNVQNVISKPPITNNKPTESTLFLSKENRKGNQNTTKKKSVFDSYEYEMMLNELEAEAKIANPQKRAEHDNTNFDDIIENIFVKPSKH